jgi:hypothetical protein
MIQGQGGFDQAGDAGGGVKMADIGLDGAEGAEAEVGGGGAEGLGEGSEFDRVAEGGGGAVGFDEGDGVGRDGGGGVGGEDDIGLAVEGGSGEGGTLGAIVIGGGALDEGVDGIVIAEGVVEAFEDHDAAAAAEEGALCLRIEWPTVTIRRDNAIGLMKVAGLVRYRNRDTTGKGKVALVIEQALAGQVDRHQRG